MLIKILKIIRNSLFLITVVLLVLVLSFQIDVTRKLYLNSLTDSLKESQIDLNIGQISGFFPFNWQVDRLKIADKKGEWLDIQDLQLDFSFARLFNSDLYINTLSARVIQVNRLPEFPPSNQKITDNENNKNSSEAFDLPFSLNVKTLKVKEILLARQLLLGLSDPVDTENEHFLIFSLAAETFLDLNSLLNGQIHVSQLDYLQQQKVSPINKSKLQNSNTTGNDAKNNNAVKNNAINSDVINNNVNIKLAFTPQTKQLLLQGNINLLRSLLNQLDGDLIDLPEQLDMGDIKLDLSGDAPIDNWQGKLSLSVNNIASLNSDLHFFNQQQRDQNSLNLTLKNNLLIDDKLLKTYQLPAALADIKLNTSIAENKLKSSWIVKEFSLLSFYGLFSSKGIIDIANESINLKTKTELEDLSKLKIFLSEQKDITELNGKMHLSTTITGKWRLPSIDYVLLGNDILVNDLDLPKITSNGTIKVIDNSTGSQDILINSKGELQELDNLQQNQLPKLNINWQIDADYKNDNSLAINQFELDSQLFNMDVKGKLDTAKLVGQFILDSQLKDLSLISPSAQEKYAGSKTLHAKAVIHENADQIELDISSNVEGLKGLPDELMVLLGEEPTWNSRLQIYNLDNVEVEHFSLNTKELKLNASAKIGLTSGELTANINSNIADLSFLSNVLSHPIAGKLQQSMQLSGTLEKPQILLQLNGEKLAYNNYQLGQLNVQSEIKDSLQNPQGNVLIDLAYQKQILQLQSDFQLKDNIFSLSKLTFQAPESKISGQLQVNLANNLATGKLDGQVKQLSKLDFLHQQDNLSGDVAFSLLIDNNLLDNSQPKQQNNVDQRIDFTLNSEQFTYDDISLENLQLNGKISGLPKAITINSKLDIDKIIYGSDPQQQKIANLSLTAKGNPDKIQIDLDSATEKRQEFIHLSSIIEQKKNSLNILLTQLEGQLLNQPLKLLKQAQINLMTEEQQVKIEPLQLRFGPSQLDLDASINQSSNKITSNVKLIDFPLELLSQLDLQSSELSQLKGVTDIDLSINGQLNNPDIMLQAAVEKLTLNSLQKKAGSNKKIPLADILLKAQLSKGLAQSQINISGLTEQAITAKLQVPVGLSLSPFKVDLTNKTNGLLKGKFNAVVDLHKLQTWIELDQQLIEGQLSADLVVSGTIDYPKLQGDILLKQGKYENAQTGTLLHDIRLNVKADNQTLTIQQLTANDSEKGQIKGNGNLLLDPALSYGYQFDLNMDKVKLLRQDDMTMQLSGDVKLDGDKHKGKVTSRINIDQGEFFLPESTGADIPQLDVVEINHQDELKNVEVNQAENNNYPLDLDVSIVIPSKFYVRGRGLESEWQGKIDIKQQLSDPLLEGSLEIKRGYFNFMSHRFNFRKGNINFVGSIPPQPQLDFEMAAAGKDMMAILKISGLAEKPDIALESEPMMPDDEILSRLLFNKDISEISGFEALQLASAVRTLATGGSGAMDKARGSLGVDTMDFNGDDGSVKVGKHISKDVYVEVESGLTSAESQVKVEMDMTDHISVESRVDQESNTGVGVNWKFDY